MYLQVHRFHKHVAVYVGGKTVYLDPADARQLAGALNACADDVSTLDPADSKIGTWAAELEDTGDHP